MTATPYTPTPPERAAPPTEEPAAGQTTRRRLSRGLDSAAAGAAADVRSYCLSRSEVRAADLQRVYRLGFSEACRVLEELEALRLLGSLPTAGARHWSVRYPVDEERVRMLRRVFGWA